MLALGLLVFVLALAPRLWGIGWQLPAALYYDELKYVGWALATSDGRPPDSTDFRNPSLFRHLLAVEYRLTDLVRPDRDRQRRAVFHYTTARVTSAVLGAGAVAATALAAARLFSPWAGAVAGLTLGLSLLHVHMSHLAVNDAPASFFLAAALLFGIRGLLAPRPREYLLAGLCAGLATAAKYNFGAILCLPLAAAVALRLSGELGSRAAARMAGLTLLGALVGLVIGMPELLWSPGAVWQGIRDQQRIGAEREPDQPDIPVLLFYAEAIVRGVGVAAAAAALVGAARLLRQNRWRGLALLAYPLAYLGVMQRSELLAARFALPLLPFVALCAAGAVVWLATARLGAWPKRAAVGLVLALITVPSALAVVHHNQLATTPDTRVLAQAWVRDHARGARVAAQPYSLPTTWEGAARPSGYRLDRFQSLTEPAALARLACNGTRYVLLATFNWERDGGARPSSGPTGYERLRGGADLVQTFDPFLAGRTALAHADDTAIPMWHLDAYARPGPRIEVYQLPEDGRTFCPARNR